MHVNRASRALSRPLHTGNRTVSRRELNQAISHSRGETKKDLLALRQDYRLAATGLASDGRPGISRQDIFSFFNPPIFSE